ncbi:MAG TPA: polysaccharide deacetylase family protein [Peptococcaceae bacterium]|nr:polysaccharide deacetylase family protein [Peptococcaceae bacterium]
MFILHITKIKFKLVTLVVIFLCLSVIRNNTMSVSRLDLPSPLEQVKTEKKVMALTVNVDWGEEYIPSLLDIFEEYQAKVTFFVTGRWAEKNPELLIEMASRGHQIENHGYSHPHPDKLSIAQNKEELLKTEEIIRELLGKKTRFYAPPYGERGKNGLLAADQLGYTTVLWTLDTIDWRADSTPELIAQRILEPKIRFSVKPEKNGAIVLMHPKENTVKALPRILAKLKDEGFEFVTIEKLITFSLPGNTTP